MSKIFLEFERLKDINSGVGQICLGLGQQIAKLMPTDMQVDCFMPEKHHGLFGDKFNYISVSRSRYKNYFKLGGRYDAWYCPHQGSKFLPRHKKTPLVLGILDLNFLGEFPEEREVRLAALQKKVDRASVITVISNFTKKMVEENLNVGSTPVKVIYCGCTIPVDVALLKPVFTVPENFILTLGVVAPKKNFHVLLEMLKRMPEHSLVIAGLCNKSDAYYQKIIAEIHRLGLQDRVVIPGIVSMPEKLWLYQNCQAFVLPSLLEGFGLPVIEAMHFGKPVFLSDKTSLPEIGGAEAYYWKNFDSDNMTEVFQVGMNDFNADPEKPNRVKTWAAKFSWEDAAKELLDVFRTIS